MENSSNSLSEMNDCFKGPANKKSKAKITKPPPGKSPGVYALYAWYENGKVVSVER